MGLMHTNYRVDIIGSTLARSGTFRSVAASDSSEAVLKCVREIFNSTAELEMEDAHFGYAFYTRGGEERSADLHIFVEVAS